MSQTSPQPASEARPRELVPELVPELVAEVDGRVVTAAPMDLSF